MSEISYFFENDFLHYKDLFNDFCQHPLSIPKGTSVCKRGHINGLMYYLLSGMVKIYTTNYFGYDRTIAFAGKHTLFGLDCIQSDMISVLNVDCLTDIQVLPLTGETIKKMMAYDESFAYDLVLYYSRVTRLLCFDVENQSINDATTRLANFLYLYMKSSSYEKTQTIDLTQESLASAINSSRVQVSRICNKLKEEGIIKIHNKEISVENSEKLCTLCHF